MMIVALYRKDPVSAAYWWARCAVLLLADPMGIIDTTTLVQILSLTPDSEVLS